METCRAAFTRIYTKAQQCGIGIILENHPQGLLADASTIAGFPDTERIFVDPGHLRRRKRIRH
jgi:deoxyribonuclease-4